MLFLFSADSLIGQVKAVSEPPPNIIPTLCGGLYNAVFTTMDITVLNPGGSSAGTFNVLALADIPTQRIGLLLAIPSGGAYTVSYGVMISHDKNGTASGTGPGMYWMSTDEDGQVLSS